MIQILTLVYGEKHVELFRRACLKSLSWPDNRQALIGATWNICTDNAYADHLKREINKAMPEANVSIRGTDQLRDFIDPAQSAVIWQIKECLKKKQRLLIAPPDTIFGEGTIGNLLLLGREDRTVLTVPHPRVLPSILTELEETTHNPSLATLAWKHLHQSWTDAEIGHVRQNSFVGGVKWQRLNEKTIAVTHRLPTPYLLDFTEEDLQYFKTQISFGSFDHVYPSDILIPRERQRYVASSDACFICEITERDKNVPPIWQGPLDGFWRHNLQSQINNQVTAIFRME